MVNDWTLQPIIHNVAFGGAGESRMGKYHQESGFRAYTNARGVLCHGTVLHFGSVRYPPYERNRRLRESATPS